MKKSVLVLGVIGLMLVLAQGALAQTQGEICKGLAKRTYLEVFKGNVDLAEQLFLPTARNYDPTVPGGEWPQGGTGLAKAVVGTYLTAFPDLDFKITKQYVDGDTAVTQWIATGTHKGPLMGMSATGKSIMVTGMNINRCEGGKIAESWTVFDLFGMLVQVGIIPPPAPPK